MIYSDFEAIMTPARMSRYLAACGGNTKKTMTLYRLNLRLSQELVTVISCYEITLRNAIDRHCQSNLGANWLRDGVQAGGIFTNSGCALTRSNINDAITKLNQSYNQK